MLNEYKEIFSREPACKICGKTDCEDRSDKVVLCSEINAPSNPPLVGDGFQTRPYVREGRGSYEKGF